MSTAFDHAQAAYDAALPDRCDDEPAPLRRPTTVLTPRGTVAVMVIRLERELGALPSADRAYVVAMLRDLIEEATS